MSDLPACCTPSEGALLPERFYCANLAGGDPATAGLNYQGLPCPMWGDVPENIRAKWRATAEAASRHAVATMLTGVMTFGDAISALRMNQRVRRAGWNGKGMWLALTEGSRLGIDADAPLRDKHGALEKYVVAEHPSEVRVCPHIDMRAADGTLVIGWLASQTDMLATDWEVVG